MKPRIGAEGDEATQPVQSGPAHEGRGMSTSLFAVYVNCVDFLIGDGISSIRHCLLKSYHAWHLLV
jgi:hypothetical protein